MVSRAPVIMMAGRPHFFRVETVPSISNAPLSFDIDSACDSDMPTRRER